MMDYLWILPLAGLGALFVFVEGFLFVIRHKKGRDARRFLMRAKQEVEEIAQIPLNDPYPLIQATGDGKIAFANPKAFEQFPLLKTQGMQHPILQGLAEIMERGETVTREVSYSDAVYYQTIMPSQAKHQNLFIIYCYDITERKRYERDLKRAHKMAELARIEAEQAREARGDFLANMSHELRTPMNGIIGLSDILMDCDLNADHKELVEAVNYSAHNLLILLNDILDFSKIEAGELTMESIPFDVRRVIRQIVNLQGPVASQRGLVLESRIGDAVPERVMGDPSRLQQVLNNLIGNALKFTHEGKVSLDVGGTDDGNGCFILNIAVTDTGIGIPEDKQATIFAKFQQADSSTARKYGGTGLGLAITKDLVRMMGGTIGIESTVGVGTTFTVSIPAPLPPPGVLSEDDSLEKPRGGVAVNTRARVLVVDDHPINLLFMRRTLMDLGFEGFDEARSGMEALALFRDKKHDLILMDCQMPEMNGFDASRKMRAIQEAICKSPVIIAVTADAMKGAEEKCLKAGMDDYISKPVSRDKLHMILGRWLAAGDDHKNGETEGDIVMNEREQAGVRPCPVFDWDHLGEFTLGDRKTETELLDMFLGHLKQDFAALEAGFRQKDYEQWNAVAHKIYGASCNIGAMALARICDEAQSVPPTEVQGRIEGLHRKILEEYKRVRDVLVSRQEAA